MGRSRHQKHQRRKNKHASQKAEPRLAFGRGLFAIGGVAAVGFAVWLFVHESADQQDKLNTLVGAQESAGDSTFQTAASAKKLGREAAAAQHFTELELEQRPRIFQWFGDVPEPIKKARLDTGDTSNIRRADYAGAESCKECHESNYHKWSSHPHRWMNAWATELGGPLPENHP